MHFKFLAALALSLFSVVFSLGQAPLKAAAPTPQGYLIGPGDVLAIKALGEKDFDVEALTVDDDGTMKIPFHDTPIVAACKTERSLQAEVAKLWSKYLRNPQISLRVTQRNSRPPISVYGEVRQQQQFTATRRVYLLELISAAGGVTEKNGGMVQVFRTRPPLCSKDNDATDWTAYKGDGLDVPSRMYSLAALRQGNSEANPEIFPGDIIVVQKASPVFVVGEVIKPGELDIPEGGLPLTQAIAMASGISREAKTKNVKIYRRKAGMPKPEVMAVNYDQIRKGMQQDVMLQPFDIVEVDKAKKSIGDILYETLTGLPGRVPIPIP